MKKTTYFVAVNCLDGTQVVAFTDPADTTNFIMDLTDKIPDTEMALAIEENYTK